MLRLPRKRVCISRVLCALLCLCGATSRLPAQNAPDDAQADLRNGVSLLQAGHVAEAKTRFDAAVSSMPQSASALTWRGISENQLKQYEAAQADFEASLQLDQKMLATHYNLALTLIHLNRIDAAIEQLKLVSAAQPSSVSPLYNLAVLFEAKGLQTEAVQYLIDAHNLAPADKDITLHLLKDELKLGKMSDLPALTQELADVSTSADIQQQAGYALLEAGRATEAAILLRQAYERAPRASGITTGLARALAAGGNLSEAISLLRQAYSSDPDNSNYAFMLARMLLASDQADEAKQILLQVSAAGSQSAQQLMLMGIALAATHEIERAAQQLQKAIQADPSLALARDVLGFCYTQKGRYADAAEEYGKASDQEPHQAMFARDAAMAFERANQRAQAIHFAERAASLGDKDAASHALLGKLYAAADRDHDAIRELLIAAKLNPDLDSALYLLARTYQRVGNQEDASAWSHKLEAVKQQHEAAFLSQKKEATTEIRSSTLLGGGVLSADGPGTP